MSMRISILALTLVIAISNGWAQPYKKDTYYYTAISEKFLSDAEVDSIFYYTSLDLFKRQRIPQQAFDKKYARIHDLLLGFANRSITASFRVIESKLSKKATVKASSLYIETKKQYINVMRKQLLAAFSNHSALSQYLTFNNSDRITSFHSLVRVNPDGKLLVTETISIYNGNGAKVSVYDDDPSLKDAGAMNDEIKRGIVRAFPLFYFDITTSLFRNTTFNLKQVLKNGKTETYHTEKHENGILVYTGSSDVYLRNGYYTYAITYETDHQLKLLKDYDELYWNVTGNGWSFRIDSASCTVILPNGIAPLSTRCYTGPQGATYEDCSFTTTKKGDSTFLTYKTLSPLPPRNGFTVAAAWKKGLVTEKSFFVSVWYTISNNPGVFLLPIAAVLSAIFCFLFWYRYGRDPKAGTVYPQFQPPAGFSPAALGYVYRQKFSQQLTAATIVDAAVRNIIQIDVKRGGLLFKHNEYHITKGRNKPKPPLTRYEDFASDVDDLVNTTIRKGKYNKSLGDLNTAVRKHCEAHYKNKDGPRKKNYMGYFALNSKYMGWPVLLCMVAGGWGLFGYSGIVRAITSQNYWQIAYFIGGIVLCVYILRLFRRLLTAYSPDGRTLMDNIEGFRMFLATADEQRFDTMAPPKKSLELFEKYLPFAIALDCEIEWGNRFEDIITTAIVGGTIASSSFMRSFSQDSQSFSSSFSSSFSGAISSASSPPSSSSGGGSFGGGSSGGGGGGGGGGGW